MRWVREIRAVGIRDWLWFVVWLRRDEFSRKLEIDRYNPRRCLVAARERAHRIDDALARASGRPSGKAAANEGGTDDR